MSLSIIGAGFGRTGTASMKIALEQLGFGPCHHMKEVTTPEQKNYWLAAAEGQIMDWDQVFEGYSSCVDWPAAFFWRELSEFYPGAKVILTVRDSESWYKSMENTILQVLKAKSDAHAVANRLVGDQLFGGRFDDKDYMVGLYEQNTRDVQARFPKDRLLTYELGSGWGPLCQFLEKPVPKIDFPKTNSAEEFQNRIFNKSKSN